MANSYGYRPGKSALEAIAVTRRRCWDQDSVVEFDIRGLFDNLDHGLLMTALRKHCQEPWILLYVERWLRAPMQSVEGQLQARTRARRKRRRFADPGQSVPALRVRSLGDAASARRSVRPVRRRRRASLQEPTPQAEYVLDRIRERFQACNLELHPSKTRIVYCKDVNRTATTPTSSSPFSATRSDPRKAVDKMAASM